MFVFWILLIFLWRFRFLWLLFLCFRRLFSLLECLGAWNRCWWFPFAARCIWTSSKKFFVEIGIISGAYNESSSRYWCFRESILPDAVQHQFVMFETLFMSIVYYHWVFGTSFVLFLVKMKWHQGILVWWWLMWINLFSYSWSACMLKWAWLLSCEVISAFVMYDWGNCCCVDG